MAELTVGDIRPLLTLAANNPLLNDSESIASQLRGILTGLGVPITSELDAALSLIEANPVLVSAGVAEFRAAIEGVPDSTLLSALTGLGDGSEGGDTGGDGGVGGDVSLVQDANGNTVKTFELPFSGTTIAVSESEVTVTVPGSAPQVLVGLDRLEFSDGTFFLDIQDGAGLVKKAYDALLGRDAPDAAGFDFWLDLYEAGTINTFALTSAFTQSDAFTQKYAAVLTDYDALLDAFYQNLYGRAADDAGKTFWTNFLENNGGAEAVDEALAYMMQSDEFGTIVGNSFADGVFV